MSYMDLPESMRITRDKLIQAYPKKIEDNEYPVHIEGVRYIIRILFSIIFRQMMD